MDQQQPDQQQPGGQQPDGKRSGTGKADRYGVEAELDRLLRCPECGGGTVRPVHNGYGLLGLRALGEFGSPRDVKCRTCGHEWTRAPMREMRREAQRRIDERYDAADVTNDRLRRELAAFLEANPPTASRPRPSAAPGEPPEPGH
jgi:DNA-directed RNA polymerase subunit RPC12/RpoP